MQSDHSLSDGRPFNLARRGTFNLHGAVRPARRASTPLIRGDLKKRLGVHVNNVPHDVVRAVIDPKPAAPRTGHATIRPPSPDSCSSIDGW